MMKKGQLEVIGLMIIVLLFIFALLFYFTFTSDDDTSIITDAEQDLEVNNMLSAVKMYTVEEDVTVKDLFKDCVSTNSDCNTAVDLVSEIIETYGWTEDQYMLYVAERLVTSECVGDTWVADFTVSGSDVRLIYCY